MPCVLPSCLPLPQPLQKKAEDSIMIAKARADQLVFDQGLAESKEQARRLIMAGKVAIFDEEHPERQPVVVQKPGHPYKITTQFQLVGVERFVSRGAYKLLTAIEHYKLDVAGLVCLDAGASTGGFTDCLLQHGASRVYAVDVGHAQLHERLRNDPRVVSREGAWRPSSAEPPVMLRRPSVSKECWLFQGCVPQ